MFIIKYKKIFVSISAVLILLSIISIGYFGLNLGIDFKGGSLTEIEYTTERPEQSVVEDSIKSLSIGQALIQPIGDMGYSIKTRFQIGLIVVFAIVLFIAYTFRKVSKPVSSWKYGLIAIVSLIHDIIIPVGVFAALGNFYSVEMDTLFVVAILTVLALSVSDTIVVFDRIRENIRIGHFKTFEETVGKSISQVYTRSIATTSTVIIVLLALVFFGPESTKVFALMLTAGMFFGTYSSIFLASPLLVFVENFQKK